MANRERVALTSQEHDPITSGVHRAYFETILNLQRHPDGTGYYSMPGIRVSDALRDVCEYLDDQTIPYQLDSEATRILRRTQGAEQKLAGAIAQGRNILQAALKGSPSVPGFKRKLLSHQWLPVEHLASVPNAANFSVPGAGKTTMVLAAFQLLKHAGQVQKLVVIGPGSAFLAWEEEYARCMKQPSEVVRLSGVPEERQVAYARARDAELVLVTYHTANNDQQELIELLRATSVLLVLDESHYVKGSGALAEMVLNIAPEATQRIVLTGTPMPNGFLDLWTQMTYLWPDQHLFGNRGQFRSLINTRAGQATAKERIRPLFTRVTKSDLHLPEQRFKVLRITMGNVQRRIYDAIAARTLTGITEIPAERLLLREWRKAKMVRLLQAASNPSLLAQHSIEFSIPPENALGRPLLDLIASYTKYEVPPKILAADKLVRKILRMQNEKVVIWTHFVHNIELLLNLLKDFGALALYGAVPREGPDGEDNTREQHIKAFRHDKGVRVLVANPGAAAESISLHKVSHHAIYLDRTFNAGQFIQSRDRIHRVGLEPSEHVTYHLILSKDTIDETVHRRLGIKEQQMQALLDDHDLPVTGVQIATDHLSGPDENEEAIDFSAVLEDIRSRVKGRK